MNTSRREALETIVTSSLTWGSGMLYAAQPGHPSAKSSHRTKEQWLDEWYYRKALVGPLQIQKFVERIYVLLAPIKWQRNSSQDNLPSVIAPKGFVTDFASIPRVFWSVLPPDGQYTYPAVIHDYMYWTQLHPKSVADEVFKRGMEDLKIAQATVTVIYEAVSKFGAAAWDDNASLKAKGERRILKCLPNDPLVRWSDWKMRTDVWQE